MFCLVLDRIWLNFKYILAQNVFENGPKNSFKSLPKPSQNPPQIHPEPSQNPPLEGSWEGVAKFSRNSFDLVSIWAPLSLHFGSIFHEKTVQRSVTFLIHFFIDFFIDLGVQMPPKTWQKSLKNQLKFYLKKSLIFRSILAWISQRFLLDFLMHF